MTFSFYINEPESDEFQFKIVGKYFFAICWDPVISRFKKFNYYFSVFGFSL